MKMCMYVFIMNTLGDPYPLSHMHTNTQTQAHHSPTAGSKSHLVFTHLCQIPPTEFA